METTFNIFESATDSILFEDQQSDFATQTFNFPGGEGEDEGGDDEEDKSAGADEDKGNGSDDDNPPLDEEVVHSPLPPQGGGKPGKK